jgi:hypothetical protein
MKLQEFISLDENKKFLTTWSSGVFLGQRTQDETLIRLYQLDNFYVEVFMLKETGSVLMIKCFEDTDHLQEYLKKINISHLVK